MSIFIGDNPRFDLPERKYSKPPKFVKYGGENEGDGRAYVHPFSPHIEGDYPSVTRITGLETGNFSRYNVEKTARWCVDNWGELGIEPERAVRRAMAEGMVYRDERAWVGTQVHDYIAELRTDGWNFPVLEDVEQQTIVHNWSEWWAGQQRTALFTELTVVNDSLGYAGTLDAIDEVVDPFTGEVQISLSDLKSSKSAGYSGHLMQLGALANAEYGMLAFDEPQEGSVEYTIAGVKRYAVRVELPVFDVFEIVHARDDGVATLVYDKDLIDSYFAEFKQYLGVFRVREARKNIYRR